MPMRIKAAQVADDIRCAADARRLGPVRDNRLSFRYDDSHLAGGCPPCLDAFGR